MMFPSFSLSPSEGRGSKSSHPRRVRLRRLRRVLGGRALERLDGARLVHVNHRVELLAQPRVEVVAEALRIRAVDHADRALQARLAQKLQRLAAAVAQVEHELVDPDL